MPRNIRTPKETAEPRMDPFGYDRCRLRRCQRAALSRNRTDALKVMSSERLVCYQPMTIFDSMTLRARSRSEPVSCMYRRMA